MGNDYEELTDNLTSWVNEYRILWVNSDYEITETFVEAQSKKKAIIEFFTEIDANDVENYKINKVN
jgi:hypothetical protein